MVRSQSQLKEARKKNIYQTCRRRTNSPENNLKIFSAWMRCGADDVPIRCGNKLSNFGRDKISLVTIQAEGVALPMKNALNSRKSSSITVLWMKPLHVVKLKWLNARIYRTSCPVLTDKARKRVSCRSLYSHTVHGSSTSHYRQRSFKSVHEYVLMYRKLLYLANLSLFFHSSLN